jgi:crotonobetaine/carnitine-CoA ligase
VLGRRVAQTPSRDFIRLPDGVAISYGSFHHLVRRTASALAQLGVRQGDTVNVWLPNGLEMVRVWFAINWLGAVYVPINTAYRGNLLAHVIANAGAKVIVASADLATRLDEIECAELETAVCIGGLPQLRTLAVKGADSLDGQAEAVPELQRPIEPWDVQSIIYTSGTTGRSKGVISSYAHLFSMSGQSSWPMLDADDVFLLYGPLFHVGGTLPVVASLNRGGVVAVGGDFSTETFWPTVRATRSTIVILLGVMSSFIEKRLPASDDRSHTLKKAIMIPLPDLWKSTADRFGLTVWTLFNMTEINVPILSEPNPAVLGSCGKLREGVHARIVDENDCEVERGKVGELVLRTEAPWELNSGYFKDPEATARAWRNGWFHTGDGFRQDEYGNYFFVDRIKDAIRRRGENISSFEVEVEILAHPDVRECAVVAVPNETAEDDVLAVVAPVPGRSIDPVQLLEFLQPRMAHFMLPRYVRILPDLPRTPTQKVEKHVLRSAGLTADTWDRVKAGVQIRREKIRG